MFGTILTTITTLMHAYVFWRATTVPVLVRHVARRTMVITGIVSWLLFLGARYFERSAEGGLATALELFAMNWLASLFLIFVAVLAVDIVTAYGWLLRRHAPALRGWGLLAGVLLAGLAMVQGLRPPVVETYEVTLAGLPAEHDGLVVVGASDFHLGNLIGPDWLTARVDQILAEKPDLIVLLGDLFEGHSPPDDRLLASFQRLKAPLGVWAVQGNHDAHYRGHESADMLAAAGIEVLHNRWTEVAGGLVLAGVEDLNRHRRAAQENDPVADSLAGRPPGAVILLSHSPWKVEQAATDGVGLMLCGHTHGGQIWPFGYLVKLQNPYLSGRYKVAGMLLIVCRGTGTWGPRMRLWPPGEILRIVLRAPPSAAGH
ncbi:MAG: metallophosphoesterase [Acidobacteria bacterium]|nr:metallophosphoesterase [Acidobacteriota bacterium]